MIELNKDKIQIRYITGFSKTLKGYPTPLDILYESCRETIDDCLFSEAKMENRYGLTSKHISETISRLLKDNYIEKKNDKYKIINTPLS